MREYTVFTGTRVIITAENEADMLEKLSSGIWEEQEVDSFVEHVGPEQACDHEAFSTSANECNRHSDGNCFVNNCDNCNAVVGHVAFKS